MEAGKKNAEREVGQLRQKLQEGFAIKKEELKVEYQKRVDDMFFYGYQCCMKKHGIVQDTPAFLKMTSIRLQAALPGVEKMLLESVPLVGMLDIVFVNVYSGWMWSR